MGMFDIDDPDAALGYRNIRAGASAIEAEIKTGLEALWVKYEPYADTNFLQAFSKGPDDRFWEMYLAVVLLDAGKRLRKRAEITKAFHRNHWRGTLTDRLSDSPQRCNCGRDGWRNCGRNFLRCWRARSALPRSSAYLRY
jgi:hypothetical protein